MGVADFGGEAKRERRGGTRHRKKTRRLRYRLDMTPLVDIAFLLLTFFMLTTTLITPQVMEMTIPPERTQVEVRESELLTLRIRADGKVFYNLGNEAPQPIALKDLESLAVRENVRLKNRLITVLKASPNVPYGVVITVLDALNRAEVQIAEQLSREGLRRERRFAIAPMTEQDEQEIAQL
ncbi:MAG: biopolymer transporter ExbD [Candidatus Kapabacteria bacterium]|nr:biopolymer transporter ExbD [Candidatus Kapabacteria bacterium]MDW8012906.1 biopolymer transporter ExbD [Bacteroidota bacterium]